VFIVKYDFISDENTGKAIVKTLVRFISGSPQLHSHDQFEVTYNSDPSKKLLEANTCFSTISLPVAHSCYEDFKQSCLTSLLYGGEGFGKFQVSKNLTRNFY